MVPEIHLTTLLSVLCRSHDFCPCPCNLTRTKDCTCRPEDPACPVYHNKEIVEQPAYLPTLTQQYANKSIEWMEESRQAGVPFFQYVAFQHSHHPQFHSTAFDNKVRASVEGFMQPSQSL